MKRLIVGVIAVASVFCVSASAATRPAWLSKKHSDVQQFYSASGAEVARMAALTLADVVAAIMHDPDYQHLTQASAWLRANPEEAEILVPHLPAMLRDDTCVGLTNSSDLIIWERIMTGDLEFYGHGGGCDDDLFQVSGRASWILKELTGQEIGSIRPDSTEAERSDLQSRWVAFLRNAGVASPSVY